MTWDLAVYAWLFIVHAVLFSQLVLWGIRVYERGKERLQ